MSSKKYINWWNKSNRFLNFYKELKVNSNEFDLNNLINLLGLKKYLNQKCKQKEIKENYVWFFNIKSSKTFIIR